MIHYYKGQYSREGVSLDPSMPAFRYGAGFFETICYNSKRLCHLHSHLDRLHHAMRAYDIRYEGIDFEDVIMQVINRNGLEGKFSRVNIFYPIEEPQSHPVVLAAPFEPQPYK
ncbi:aminotransferase IV, partial [Pseudodesulfovibrio sp.]|nr:aminotransferase IV [Pseudodesulfovibrio sp.]